MGYQEENLWKILEEKSTGDRKFIDSIEEMCDFAIKRDLTIRDTFPNFTLHDETHICNVLRLMDNLLGKEREQLTPEECAMLVLAACYHDIGMSYSKEDRERILKDHDRLNAYLDANPSAFIIAYSNDLQHPTMTEEIIQDYFRAIHHERVSELLVAFEWPTSLRGRVDRDHLIRVCQSHCQNNSALDDLNGPPSVDLRMCAVLLRLADILDFDITRAPKPLYDYENIDYKPQSVSYSEWQKHLASSGFNFNLVDRRHPYRLPYSATCKSMQIEHIVREFLDWVDRELIACAEILHRYDGRWKALVLPAKIDKHIESVGYVSGEYHLTLDHDQLLKLLAGENMYGDPAVFVRELLQNAIDAVRTREKLDKQLPNGWKPQIQIRTWMDAEGFHWFRIEDNGIGMSEPIIREYFLKIGRSYYSSDDFYQEKLLAEIDPSYTPISRFGIGILSCFIGGDKIEVSTKRYHQGGTTQPALRLRMYGLEGYYYLANRDLGHVPGPMVGQTDIEREPYLNYAGTIIAVRTNLYKYGVYKGFKELVEKYLTCAPVPVHYSGPDGECDFCTEEDIMKMLHAPSNTSITGRFEYFLSPQQIEMLKICTPGVKWITPPKVVVQCIAFDGYCKNPYLSGGTISMWVEHEYEGAVRINSRTRQNMVNPHSLETSYESVDLKKDVTPKIELKYENQKIFLMIDVDIISDPLGRLFGNMSEGVEPYWLRPTWSEQFETWDDEVFMAVKCGLFKIEGFESYIQQKHRITSEQLSAKINELQNSLKISKGVFYKDPCPSLKFTLNYNIKDSWSKVLEYCHNSGMIIAHNGIISEKNYHSGLTSLWTLVMIKDKFCPTMDVSREEIRSLPINFTMTWLLLTQKILLSGIHYEESISKRKYFDHTTASLSEWLDALHDDPEVRDTLKIPTNLGFLTVNEISNELRQKKSVIAKLEVTRDFGNRLFSSSDKDAMLECLFFVVLQRYFSCCIDFAEKNTIRVSENDNESFYRSLTAFPPALFMRYPEEHNDKLLCDSSFRRNHSCNYSHPFSRWLSSNQVELKMRVPGILSELVRALSESYLKELVPHINGLISKVRNLPGTPIRIPDGIFLKETDILVFPDVFSKALDVDDGEH